MPSNATITSFHSFQADTKARASQVNSNFSNFRGHSLPIDPNTAAATDLTYDLGSDEHRWRVGYVRDIDLETSTSTATLILKGDTSATTGAFLFQIEGVTKSKIDTDGFDGSYIKAGSITPAARSSMGATTTAALGQLAMSPTSNEWTHTTTSYADATNMSITITTSGRPVYIGFTSDGDTSGSASGYIRAGAFTTTAIPAAKFHILRASTSIYQSYMQESQGLYIPPASLNHVDTPAAGTYTYKLQAAIINAQTFVQVARVKMYAYEL